MKSYKIPIKKRVGLELYRQYKKRVVKEHPLSTLFWECTLRCNLSCRHCGSDCRSDIEQKDMPLYDFLKVVDSITPHVDPNKTMIVITGGEPILHKEIERCGEELYKRGYPWGMVSNGMAFTEEKLVRLLNAGLGAATISLDGLEQHHNEMRGHKNSFKNAIQAIEALVKYREHLEFDVVTCVTSQTLHQIYEIKEMLIGMGVRRWRLFTIFPIGRAAQDDELQLKPKEFKSVFDFIREARKEGRIEVSYGCEGFLGGYETEVRDNFFNCQAGVNIGSVLVDGSISACPNLRARFIQGNIYEDDFMEVWNNRYREYRDREWMRVGECENCKEFRYCQGNGMHLRGEEGELLFCHLNRLKEAEK